MAEKADESGTNLEPSSVVQSSASPGNDDKSAEDNGDLPASRLRTLRGIIRQLIYKHHGENVKERHIKALLSDIQPKEEANLPSISISNQHIPLLKYLSSTEKKVCLVIVDYAALSTVPVDVQALVKNHKSLEYIVVDRLKETGRYEVYRRMKILQTPDCLDSFNCRKGLPHRSI
ncbi:hypothetical protein K501DRAFT_269136 [Backusella circina FSU 941]|nr:hypothetical protein K501DRAFT_269136 [Backusella circina FSU 941]